MTPIELELDQFVQRLDMAIAAAENEQGKALDPLIVGQAKQTIQVLKSFREQALNGTLPRPSKGDVPPGTGLGLGRGMGEWPQSDALLNAVYAVERYYREVL